MTLGTFFGGGEDEFSGLHRTHDAVTAADNCPSDGGGGGPKARSDLQE